MHFLELSKRNVTLHSPTLPLIPPSLGRKGHRWFSVVLLYGQNTVLKSRSLDDFTPQHRRHSVCEPKGLFDTSSVRLARQGASYSDGVTLF